MAMISKNAKQPMEGMASASMPGMTAEGSNGPNVTGGMKKGSGYMNEGAPKVGGGYRTGDNIPGKKGGMAPSAKVANEAGKGFGGRVIKDMK
jgi:hypothetical protein